MRFLFGPRRPELGCPASIRPLESALAADDRLYQLAVVLVAGIIGGEFVGRIHLPKVTGWIFTGILLRGSEQYHGTTTGVSSATPEDINYFIEDAMTLAGVYDKQK